MRWARLVLIPLLVLAACGGGSKDESKASSDSASSSSDAVTASSDSSSSDASSDSSSSDGTAETTTTTSATKTTSTTARSSTQATDPRPAEGDYTYHLSGSTTFSGKKTAMNEDVITTITRLDGGRMEQSSDGQKALVRFVDDEVQLLTLDITQPGFERHFVADPPVRYVPLPMKVGATWSWKLKAQDATTTFDQTARIDRTETITVAGRTVKAVVLVTHIVLSGDMKGTIDATSFYDPVLRVPVRTHQTGDFTFGTFRAQSDATLEFKSFSAA
jgi:hypothetical protein